MTRNLHQEMQTLHYGGAAYEGAIYQNEFIMGVHYKGANYGGETCLDLYVFASVRGGGRD